MTAKKEFENNKLKRKKEIELRERETERATESKTESESESGRGGKKKESSTTGGAKGKSDVPSATHSTGECGLIQETLHMRKESLNWTRLKERS